MFWTLGTASFHILLFKCFSDYPNNKGETYVSDQLNSLAIQYSILEKRLFTK